MSRFEPIMAALFAQLVASATVSFSANGTEGAAVLSGVADLTDLFAGLPVFGPGVPEGATIADLDVIGQTVTLSDALTIDAPAGAFTTGFLTTGRRLKSWTQVTAQPALFLRRIGSDDHYSGEMQIQTLNCEIWIYSNAGADPAAIPDGALSNLDDLVRTAFAPDVYGDFDRCTLGGVAYWARIEGHSDYSPGDQGGQGISRIPVRVTLDPGL